MLTRKVVKVEPGFLHHREGALLAPRLWNSAAQCVVSEIAAYRSITNTRRKTELTKHSGSVPAWVAV